MCVMSMVHDHFDKIIPWVEPFSLSGPIVPYVAPSATTEPFDLGKALRDYAEATKAAKVVDEATKQPDCEDPEKAKLAERVKELEAMLAGGVEFVVVKGKQLEPGRYRVIDGKLYREAECEGRGSRRLRGAGQAGRERVTASRDRAACQPSEPGRERSVSLQAQAGGDQAEGKEGQAKGGAAMSYEAFIASCSKVCRCCPQCCDHPCAGTMAGGLCDEMRCHCDDEPDVDENGDFDDA